MLPSISFSKFYKKPYNFYKAFNEYIIYYQIVSYSKISKIENESSIDSNYETVIMKGKGKSIYKALKEKGWFEDNGPKLLVVCGDMMDRGREALKMQAFIDFI